MKDGSGDFWMMQILNRYLVGDINNPNRNNILASVRSSSLITPFVKDQLSRMHGLSVKTKVQLLALLHTGYGIPPKLDRVLPFQFSYLVILNNNCFDILRILWNPVWPYSLKPQRRWVILSCIFLDLFVTTSDCQSLTSKIGDANVHSRKSTGIIPFHCFKVYLVFWNLLWLFISIGMGRGGKKICRDIPSSPPFWPSLPLLNVSATGA